MINPVALRRRMIRRAGEVLAAFAAGLLPMPALMAAGGDEVLDTPRLRVELQPADAAVTLVDKATGTAWRLGAPRVIQHGGRAMPPGPAAGLSRSGSTLRYRGPGGASFRLSVDEAGLEYEALRGSGVEEVRLLDRAIGLRPGPDSYLAIPHRLGLLLEARGDKPYTRAFGGYRGYSMAMFGAVSAGSALLAHWDDPYIDLAADYSGAPDRTLRLSVSLRGTARSIRLAPLGRGSYMEIARAYRDVAGRRGLLVTLARKIQSQPRVAELFGAANIKPFAFIRRMPGTRLNKTNVPILEINHTFDECAELAEHLKKDLGMDRAMLVVNGWVNGGYDNRHPDILPAAPEIGGNEGLARCSRRVKALGWLFGLHDNYQDMYHDAASWDERYIMKNRDASLRKGGIWPGGQCWLICSRKSLELARRPQNIPMVRKLFEPTIYFSDTIFASPPYECFDPRHPLSLNDDLEEKKKLCDYLRRQFGLFGSEDGREWGVPHADYFEGLLSHKTRFTYWSNRPPHDDVVIPLFHLVYADAVQIYAHQSDRPAPDNPSSILDHILYAEMPVYYFGAHRYWTDPAKDFQPPAGSEARMVFARGGRYPPTGQFIKNTYEVLSPLNQVTALLPMTEHRFVTPDRLVETSRFGEDVRVMVNYGESDYTAGGTVLPRYGFLVESPTFVAFHARRYQGVEYAEPSLFVMRALDGKPLAASRRVRIYRAFGDTRIAWRGKILRVITESIVDR